jgi:glutaredoxin
MMLRGFVVLLWLATAGLAQAQPYRWTDDKGVVRYSDRPPPASARDVQKIDVDVSKPQAAPVPYELARLQKDFPVTLYTSPNCKEGCGLARGALNKRGVPFTEVQVWNAETNDELKRVSGSVEVPTLLVGRSVQKGFEQGAFDALLDSAGYPKAGILPALSQRQPSPPEGYVPAGGAAKAEAQPVPAPAPRNVGPYDTSGLQGVPQKPGQYDPGNLQGTPQKPGQYGIPGASAK